MKNAIIFHGTSCTPEMFWYPYVKQGLEEKGYDVWVPNLPQAGIPDVTIQLPFVLNKGTYNHETVIIGHSAGCPLILSVLENIKVTIKQAILVAGYCDETTNKKQLILQNSYDWGKIKDHVKDIIFINSDNDPWKCDDVAGRKLFNNLGGTQIILHGEAHMGSTKFNQLYKEFPLLVKLIE